MEAPGTSGIAIEIDHPTVEIAAYLDGELTPDAELELEFHLSRCELCAEELNIQKNLLNALDGSLADCPQIPADFTKRVVAVAESDVSGLRKKRERLNAILVSTGLLLFVLLTLGAKAVGTFASFFEVAARAYAVAALAAHFVYDILEGIVIVLRSLTAQPSVSIPLTLAALAVVALLSYFVLQTRKNTRSQQIESGNI
jgi:anti-sigma factor RsiW